MKKKPPHLGKGQAPFSLRVFVLVFLFFFVVVVYVWVVKVFKFWQNGNPYQKQWKLKFQNFSMQIVLLEYDKKIIDSKFNCIDHLHDEFILLLRLESFSVFLSCANKCFCLVNLAGITNFEYEGENEKGSGRNSKMTPSCIWSIVESSWRFSCRPAWFWLGFEIAKETRSLLTLFTYLPKFHEIILFTPVWPSFSSFARKFDTCTYSLFINY